MHSIEQKKKIAGKKGKLEKSRMQYKYKIKKITFMQKIIQKVPFLRC